MLLNPNNFEFFLSMEDFVLKIFFYPLKNLLGERKLEQNGNLFGLKCIQNNLDSELSGRNI